MTRYRLVYFNLKVRGELIRWMFNVLGVEFEDVRIPYDEWPENSPIKPADTPFGQVPTLEIDGKMYCQLFAICRYLANKYGLNGDTLEDKAHADMILDICEDLVQPLVDLHKRTRNMEKKIRLFSIYQKEQLPTFMSYLENILKQNNGGHGWFIGEKMTWADLAVVLQTTVWLEIIHINPCWVDYPLLKSLKERVESLPQLKRWFRETPYAIE